MLAQKGSLRSLTDFGRPYIDNYCLLEDQLAVIICLSGISRNEAGRSHGRSTMAEASGGESNAAPHGGGSCDPPAHNGSLPMSAGGNTARFV